LLSRSVTVITALALLAAVALGGVALERRASDPPAKAAAELKIRHQWQETLLCVPTAAAMILDYYGDPQPPRRLKRLSRGQAYDPRAPFDDFTITPFRDLIRGMAPLGYAWREQTYPDTKAGFDTGMLAIEGEVRAGRPVMVDVSAGRIGHTVVISGADSRTRMLVVVDPDTPSPGRHVMSYEQFSSFWNERAYGGAFRAMVVTRQKA
jgi:hypothetical protein